MKSLTRPPALLSSLFLASSLLLACGQEDVPDAPCEDGKCDSEQSDLKLCAAIRGNGQLITAHFGSLARIGEEY